MIVNRRSPRAIQTQMQEAMQGSCIELKSRHRLPFGDFPPAFYKMMEPYLKPAAAKMKRCSDLLLKFASVLPVVACWYPLVRRQCTAGAATAGRLAGRSTD